MPGGPFMPWKNTTVFPVLSFWKNHCRSISYSGLFISGGDNMTIRNKILISIIVSLAWPLAVALCWPSGRAGRRRWRISAPTRAVACGWPDSTWANWSATPRELKNESDAAWVLQKVQAIAWRQLRDHPKDCFFNLIEAVRMDNFWPHEALWTKSRFLHWMVVGLTPQRKPELLSFFDSFCNSRRPSVVVLPWAWSIWPINHPSWVQNNISPYPTRQNR